MGRVSFCAVVLLLLIALGFPGVMSAQDRGETLLPAGTLVHCTMEEPNFSSKTAEVGDPVICQLSSVVLFGRSVFPRGAYLGGHFAEDKEPGHFVGKGYLRLEFDHIGILNDQVPLPTKVVAVPKYKVDKQGDILGKGHPTRDAIEWMIPLLWPIKVLTLPARGPRPTLKGEEQLTLRIMDDVVIQRGPSQGDMNSCGFLPRHWQQIEAECPIAMTTFLGICEILEMRADELVRDLDRSIYEGFH
jgi:hypothetical protein